MTAIKDTLAEIVFVRDSERDIKIRGLELFVDGEFVHDLSFKAEFRWSLQPGTHTVTISNHLYKKTQTLELEAGERIEFLVGNSFTAFGGLMVTVLGMGPYRVFLEERSRSRIAEVSQGVI